MRYITAIRLTITLFAVALLVTGAAYAMLLSQRNSISGSRMTSTSANLLISKQEQGTFQTSLPGFEFLGVEPDGGAWSADGHSLYFKNTGSEPLRIGVSLDPARLANLKNANLAHVYLHVFRPDTESYQEIDLGRLIQAHQVHETHFTGLTVPSGSTARVELRMRVDSAAIGTTTESFELENIDLMFTGSTTTL